MSARPPSQIKALVFGGLLPVLAFTVIEEWKGPVWGTIAGLTLGAGEILYEWRKEGRVSSFTWTSNLFILVLGIIAIFTQEGLWFKLQPALLMLAMAGWVAVSSWRRAPLLVSLARKQNPEAPSEIFEFLKALNLRLGLFFLAAASLSVHAAWAWPTRAWALLKGAGLPILLLLYLTAEVALFRLRNRRRK